MSTLGMKAADHLSQTPNRTCERCGLLTPKGEKACVHCGELDDYHLGMMLDEQEKEKSSNFNIGNIFFILALIVAFLFSFTFFM